MAGDQQIAVALIEVDLVGHGVYSAAAMAGARAAASLAFR